MCFLICEQILSQLEFIFISGFRNDIDNHDDDKGDRDDKGGHNDHGDDDDTDKVWLMATLPTAHLMGKHSRGKSAGLEGSAGTNVS